MYGVLWSTPCLGILWLRYCATTLLRLGRPTSEPIPSVVGLNRLRHSACYLVLFWSFQLSPYTEIIQVLGPSSRDSKFPMFFSFVRSTEYRIWPVFSRENTKPPFVCLGLKVWNPRTGELDPAEPNLQGLESGLAKEKKNQLEIQNVQTLGADYLGMSCELIVIRELQNCSPIMIIIMIGDLMIP